MIDLAIKLLQKRQSLDIVDGTEIAITSYSDLVTIRVTTVTHHCGTVNISAKDSKEMQTNKADTATKLMLRYSKP